MAGQFAIQHSGESVCGEAATSTKEVSELNKVGRDDRYFDDEAEEGDEEVFTYMI